MSLPIPTLLSAILAAILTRALSLSIVPNTLCSHTSGVHIEDFHHLCLGACETSSVSSDMEKVLVLTSTLTGFKAYGYQITLKRRTSSSHVSFFGSCHISSSVEDEDPKTASQSLIDEVLSHGGPGGSMDFTRSPKCEWNFDNKVSGIIVDYHRVMLEVTQTDDGSYSVIILDSGASGKGVSGTVISGNLLFAWDVKDQLPKCRYRVIGSTHCSMDKETIRCKGETMKGIVRSDEDCGVDILVVDDGSYIGKIKPGIKIPEDSGKDSSLYDLYSHVIDMESIICHHLCQEVEGEGINAHSEFLMTTPIGDWLSVKAEDHRMMFQCSRTSLTMTVPPVVCGTGPLVQVMAGGRPMWWNVSSAYVNPNSACIPSMSTELIINNRIKTWLGEVVVSPEGFSFSHKFTDLHFHPAFRPLKGLKLSPMDDLTPLINGLVSASKVVYKKHNILEEKSSVWKGVLDSVSNVMDSAVQWVKSWWPDVKDWVVKLVLWILVVVVIVMVIWGLLSLIKAIIIARIQRPPPTIVNRAPSSTDVGLMEWAKSK
uniref:Glycoprotein n=1 Tax=Vinca chlorotic spot virus TaxID=3076770 RepID=A0AA96HE38_9RHAB|nr:glycoprotein [Vinca chlorotic spot virus]